MLAMSCPISNQRVDSYVARFRAFLVLVTAIMFLLGYAQWLMYFFCLDFFILGFIRPSMSPVCLLIKHTLTKLNIKKHPVDAAPKLYAAKIGFICTALIIVFSNFGLTIPTFAILAMLMACAALESFFDFCVGCQMYHISNKLLKRGV